MKYFCSVILAVAVIMLGFPAESGVFLNDQQKEDLKNIIGHQWGDKVEFVYTATAVSSTPLTIKFFINQGGELRTSYYMAPREGTTQAGRGSHTIFLPNKDDDQAVDSLIYLPDGRLAIDVTFGKVAPFVLRFIYNKGDNSPRDDFFEVTKNKGGAGCIGKLTHSQGKK